MELYKEKLLHHYHNPLNRGHLKNPDFVTQEINPSCGDIITMEGQIMADKLTDVRFTGKGCIISQATASLLTQDCKGKTTTEILELNEDYVNKLLDFKLGPLRLKCALLALHALQEGIKTYSTTHKG